MKKLICPELSIVQKPQLKVTHTPQTRKMLKYKKGKFLFIFAKKRALLITFVEFMTIS